MAGIYFHIPFCKTRCLYCDFFSSAGMEGKDAYIEAMCRELQDRKDYLKGEPVDTIYFGGGSPSQLAAQDFEKIFSVIAKTQSEAIQENAGLLHFARKDIEVTLEANPDDLSADYLESLRKLPFNRISLGIQSFDDNELKFLNRRHDARSAIRAVERCREKGFENISIDLMYGLPGQTLKSWQSTINQSIELNIQHISGYHLIYEEGTPLFDLWQRGKVRSINENRSVAMFEALIGALTASGFEHYEISNFARPGYRSRHNSAYWDGTPYLGIGATAHSYNGVSRQWNRAVAGANYRMDAAEVEILDEKAHFNDFILTRLRTMKGINLQELQTLFGEGRKEFCLKQSEKFRSGQLLEIVGNHLRLTRKGIFVSDGIMSDLMI